MSGSTATHGELYWGVSDSLAMIGRSIRHATRDVESLLTGVILPIILLLLFVYVFGGAITTDTEYINYVVPGIILLCAGFGSASTSVSVCTDMVGGLVERLRSMPILASAVLTGHVVSSVLRNLCTTALVIGVAVIMGFRPSASGVEWVAVIALLALFMLAISWTAAALGVVAGSPEAANGFTFGFLFLPYVSSAFVPTESMPGPLRAFAEHQPITPVIETMRGLLTGTAIGSSGWLAVAWCTALTVISYAAATALFRRRTRG